MRITLRLSPCHMCFHRPLSCWLVLRYSLHHCAYGIAAKAVAKPAAPSKSPGRCSIHGQCFAPRCSWLLLTTLSSPAKASSAKATPKAAKAAGGKRKVNSDSDDDPIERKPGVVLSHGVLQ